MKIKIDLKFFIILAFLIICGRSRTYLNLFIFITIHEFGHLICGFACGLKPQTLSIMPFGLRLSFNSFNIKWWKELVISLAGPFTNLLLALLFLYTNVVNKSETAIYSNLLICIFNLFPISPLDGGRALVAILKKYYSIQNVYKINKIVSCITMIILSFIGTILAVLLKNAFLFFSLIYLWVIFVLENRRMKFIKFLHTYSINNTK